MKSTEELSREGIIFEAKPDVIPYNYRISYKVSVICLLMKICCGRKGCSLVKIHIIANALADNNFKQVLINFLESNIAKDIMIRFDPAINRALEYAIADKMIAQQANGAYKLVDKGKQLVKQISNDSDVLKEEKIILERISFNLTEEKIKQISERWNYQNVKNK